TMFRLLAKRRIHEANSEPELLMLMATTPAPALASVAPETPREVCLIVDRALAFDKRRRYPDAHTMQDDVRAVRRGEPPRYAEARLAEGDAPDELPSENLFVAAPDLADRPTVVPARPAAPAPPESPGSNSSNQRADGLRTAVTVPDAASPRVARTIVMDEPQNAAISPMPKPAGHTTVPETAPMKRTSRATSVLAIVALLVLAVAGAGLGWTLRGEAGSAPKAPSPGASPNPAP
ncbi:MAG: hypothetical protein L6Q76_26410, partial [Polyangiaceae bacterium]|nr:hypothetical protein [Polyangiaceae bacterium]